MLGVTQTIASYGLYDDLRFSNAGGTHPSAKSRVEPGPAFPQNECSLVWYDRRAHKVAASGQQAVIQLVVQGRISSTVASEYDLAICPSGVIRYTGLR